MNAVTSNVIAKKFTLVIDAGHGGRDAGAVGKISKEKDINLKTALAFGRYVERNCSDVEVVYTRKTDVFVTLAGRADIANRRHADLFISIHTNSLPSGHTARGMETYTLGMHRASDNLDVAKRENSVILVEKDYKERYQGFDPNSAESYIIFELMQDNNMQRSVELAQLVQRNTCREASRPDKGVKQAGFLVLRETSMPSCLIELGFISTPAEETLLNDTRHIDNIARGIYKAFVAYKKKYDTTAGADAVVERKRGTEKKTRTDNVKKTKDTQPEQVKTQAEQRNSEAAASDKPSQSATKARRNADNADATESLLVQPLTADHAPATLEEQTNDAKEQGDADSPPVFKLQIFTAGKALPSGDARFKGQKDVDYYKEGGLLKYTLGASTNYNEIYRLRKDNAERFPGCFIIAFRNGEKMDVNEAIREFRQRK